jgi:hypothetical protein
MDRVTWRSLAGPLYDEQRRRDPKRRAGHASAVIRKPRQLPGEDNLVVISVEQGRACGTVSVNASTFLSRGP